MIDIGPSTAACLAYAVHHLRAAGGVLVGNPSSQPHIVGLQFWAEGPRPLSARVGSLERLDNFINPASIGRQEATAV